MAGANPERSSWVSEEVGGNLSVDWYRPIEAYIDQKVQVITAQGNLYISTSRGLVVLKADTGELVWRYDTELPLGHSPTVVNNVVYVGGFDRQIHALNATTGAEIWTFKDANAGYDTNPLVVTPANSSEAIVYMGNRDGYFYAVKSTDGKVLWQYPQANQEPLGPIKFSASYDEVSNTLYFASSDMHAYALDATTGALLWQSNKLPGEDFQSWWPVVYQDKVVFPGSIPYRHAIQPGTMSITHPYVNGDGSISIVGYDDYVNGIERDDLFPPETNPVQGTFIGPTIISSASNGSWNWVDGTTVMDTSRVTEYLENKPWRRTTFYLHRSNGTEYTFDSDGDGNPEYAPVVFYGTKSGNTYPPMVMPNGVIYQNNHYKYNGYISRGQIMGWKMGTAYMSLNGGDSAVDEPQAISGGGNVIYRNLCCSRLSQSVADITDPSFSQKTYWNYGTTLETLAPGFDENWYVNPNGYPGWDGYYRGGNGSTNGIYNEHGDQNPLVPYSGRMYTIRRNAVIALGSIGGAVKKTTIPAQQVPFQDSTPRSEMVRKLETEVSKLLAAGMLKPAYRNSGMTRYGHLSNYFENPGDTLYALSIAYWQVNHSVQSEIKTYLDTYYIKYFANVPIARIGYAAGTEREYMDIPPEVAADVANNTDSTWVGNGWSWNYPQHNLYALWKYAQISPEKIQELYTFAKSKVQAPANASNDRLAQYPWEHNAYIAGYIGFLNLQQLAGKDTVDIQLRTTVQTELDRLLALRVSQFSKDDQYTSDILRRKFTVARNFMYLVPELGAYLHDNAFSTMQQAIDEYSYVAPFWFVSNYEATNLEGVVQHLWDSPALFQAKAQILKVPYEELSKYLDVPAVARGDLFYIDNLVSLLEATSSATVTPTPSGIPVPGDTDGDSDVDIFDYNAVITDFGKTGAQGFSAADFDGDGDVDIFDYNVVISNFGR